METAKEYILCSAEWYHELPTPHHRPSNVIKGMVFCGKAHIHCIHQAIAMTGKKQHELGSYESGFLTSHNRFVNRIEGGEIALKSGQIKELKYHKKHLFSEDLY